MQDWIPKSRTIEDDIRELEARREVLQWRRMPITQKEAPIQQDWVPTLPEPSVNVIDRPTTIATPLAVKVTSSVSTLEPPKPPVPQPERPTQFWERALQVFAAPFVWVDENIIKPGLGLAKGGVEAVEAFIGDPSIPDTPRKAGEDFWEWKRRSWEEWKSPGIVLNMPWGDWNVDIAGVLEFAPWLFIPGVGQVGGAAGLGARLAGVVAKRAGTKAGIAAGTRTAKGVAGILGDKLGLPGRVLGTAVEYSPWGLVEKTAGAAIGKGVRVIAGTTGKISTRTGERVFGKLPELPTPTPAVQRFTSWFRETVMPAREAFVEVGKPALRQRQTARAAVQLEKGIKGEVTPTEAVTQARAALAGGEKAKFAVTPPENLDVNELVGQILHAAEKDLTKTDAGVALIDLLTTGALPEPHHIKVFAKVYGKEFADVVAEISKLQSGSWEKFLDVANLPRAVLASGDMSAIARQGLILGLAHPIEAGKAAWKSLKAFGSEKLALDIDAVLKADDLFDEFISVDGYFAPIEKAARVGVREEAFASRAAEKIPFIRRSERAFVTHLNALRLGSYKSVRNTMVAQGAGKQELEMLAKFVNLASGRGTLPKNLDKFAPLLNTVLFSPRLQMSRLQLPKLMGQMLTSKNPYMRKEATRALGAFAGGGATLLGLLHFSGLAKIGADPRSADFGKIRLREGEDVQGNPIYSATRHDVWTGYVQYIRFMAQFMTGERKSAYGNLNKADRFELAFRFAQSKTSPAMGLMVDLMKAEDYQGKKLFTDTQNFLDTARNRLLPLALQDVMDSMEQSGANGFFSAAPAFIGVGTLTYVNELARARDKIAIDLGFDFWEEIDPKTKREIENTNIELQTAMLEFDRQVMGTAWGDWRVAGNAVEDTFAENVNNATDKYRQSSDGYQYRLDVGEAWSQRRGGYKARDKDERFSEIVARNNIQDDKEALVKLGPEQLAIRAYNEALYGDDMYDEFGDYRYDEAETRRQYLREQLGEEMFNYVEDYQGLKYENLPMEFQLLADAKKVLRSYWNVPTGVEAIRGKPQTTWQQTRFDSVVSKIRKNYLRDPEMAKFYDMFYRRPS